MPSDARIDVVLSWSRAEAGTTVVLQQREDGTWDEVGRSDGTEYTIAGVQRDRTYVFAAAALEADGDLVPEEEWETLRVLAVADKATPSLPSTPTGLAAVQDGASVALRWNEATDGVTASYEVRVGDTWEAAALVAAEVTGTSLSWAWSSSGAHTLHVKAVDRLGRVSDAASAALTIEPLGDHVTADESDQAAAGWPGAKSNVEVVGGALQLARVPPWSDWTMPWTSLSDLPWNAKLRPLGTYETPAFDALQVEKQRVEVALGATQPLDPLPWTQMHMPALGSRSADPFTARNTWQMEPIRPADVLVEIDTSPTPDGPWDGWRVYAPGTYSFRRCRLRTTLRGDGRRSVHVPRLVLTRRKLNRKLEGDVVVNCAPVDVVFATPFQNPPKVTAHLVGYAGTALVTNVTTTGFTIAGGAAVFVGDPATFAPTVHWQALGT